MINYYTTVDVLMRPVVKLLTKRYDETKDVTSKSCSLATANESKTPVPFSSLKYLNIKNCQLTTWEDQKLQNWGVRITRLLCKYDHVSHHMKSLSWLPIVHLIQYRSNCTMYHHYTNNVILLFPPVTFGHQHECDTCRPVHFANLPRCRLSSTQHFLYQRC